MSQKIVLKVQLNCKKCQQRAMKTVAGIEGVVSVAADWKEQKMAVIGDADPVCLTVSLRKFGCAELVSVGPSKEPEKKKSDAKQPEKKPAAEQPEKKPAAEQPKKKPAANEEPPKQTQTSVIIPKCCHYCRSYAYYFSDENPNACFIL